MDVVTALSKLLVGRSLRDDFARSPEKVAKSLSDDADDIAILRAINVAELQRQAELLISKRLREVTDLVPHSMSDQSASFKQFTTAVWPNGQYRHWHDALGFLHFLIQKKSRVCLREYLKVSIVLHPGKHLCKFGYIHTSRGWRFGGVLHLPSLKVTSYMTLA